MQAMESPSVRAQTVHTTGTLIKWEASRGWGLISVPDAGRDGIYFAHYSQFVGECSCGTYVHRCLIKQGMEVEFTTTPGVAHKGPFAPANEIRIKERGPKKHVPVVVAEQVPA